MQEKSLNNHSEHNKIIEELKLHLENEETVFEVADLFKIFADSTRVKILSALFLKELSVCCIADITQATVSAVSHQLRILRQAKLVKCRKQGKEVYYTLSDNHVYEILNMAILHVKE